MKITFDHLRNKIMKVAADNNIAGIVLNNPTDFTLYDMVDLSNAGTNGQVLSFFNNTNGKTFPLTNLTSNTLTAGQIAGIYGMVFSIHTKASGKYSKPLNIEQAAGYEQLLMSDATFLVQNQVQLQSLSLMKGSSFGNPEGSFGCIATGGTSNLTITNNGDAVIYLDSAPVLLPNNLYEVQVKLPAFTAPSADAVYLRCTLLAYGTLAVAPNNR
jgi:hypothetical protein